MPAPSPNLPARASWRRWLPGLIALGAFAIGLLLFLVLWLSNRDGADSNATESAPTDAVGRRFDPLPAPLPADRAQREAGASGMDDSPAPAADRTPAQAPSRPIAPAPPPPPAAPEPRAPVADAAPEAVRAPAPRYPRSAQRRGEAGTVVLRVHVDAQGRVQDVDLVQSSNSRALDRAASDTVRRWRFRPAMRDGRPVPGTVQIPIEFNLAR